MAQIDFKRVARSSTVGWLFAGLLAVAAVANCGDDDDDNQPAAGSGGKAGAGGGGVSGTGGAGGAGGSTAQGATVQVTATYQGSTQGKFYWALLPDAGGLPGAPPLQFDTPTPTFPGSFSFSIPNVAAGSYFVGAFIDTTALGEPLPTDPQDFVPITVAAGQTSVPVSLTLVENTGGTGGGGAGGSGGAGGGGGSGGSGGAGGGTLASGPTAPTLAPSRPARPRARRAALI